MIAILSTVEGACKKIKKEPSLLVILENEEESKGLW